MKIREIRNLATQRRPLPVNGWVRVFLCMHSTILLIEFVTVAEFDCSRIMAHFNTQLTRHNRKNLIMIMLEYKHQSSRDGHLLNEQHQN